jgi:cytochrome c5
MTRTPSGTRLLLAAAALFVTVASYGQAAPVAAAPAQAASQEESEGKDLPDGAGKTILMRACTTCHGLAEITKFKGHYQRAQWNDIVVTMAAYGAEVDSQEIEVLTDYLNQHLGKKD